jgi:site-specific recombinase XerD
MDIQALLGHSTIDTTPMDTYVRQKRMAAVISRL